MSREIKKAQAFRAIANTWHTCPTSKGFNSLFLSSQFRVFVLIAYCRSEHTHTHTYTHTQTHRHTYTHTFTHRHK